ncbi:cation diffusion facilitator family transporter [Caldibacillus lycopersici]|uniref:Cation diffusion facilitator family transporter n=1 Tax=Perspicuibacillus lycopersici TaxID=1325689 RepID=A0AAE3LLH5_9BACI|nr:cation diffusion facilitator family transporter [Perspicuibacillus lycopersici]MCU9611951.1 cation diffusion facilitator family transporter [Perspicuibacillus lycopersici]
MNDFEDLKSGEKGVWLSIIAYLTLSIVKISVAYIGNSEALRADGLNNATDVIGSIAILIGLKIASKPPDDNHHYGHYRAETIASLIASIIMFIVGMEVLIGSISRVLDGNHVSPDLLTAWIAGFSALFMFFVYRYNLKLAKKINSQGLLAAAYDNRSDALVSVGAIAGIIGGQFQLFWLDPLAAVVVGVVIIKTAWDILRNTIYFLTDGYDEERITQVVETITKTEGVLTVKEVRARMLGNRTFLDATIGVDPKLTVAESHKITEDIEKVLESKYGIPNVLVHTEPVD